MTTEFFRKLGQSLIVLEILRRYILKHKNSYKAFIISTYRTGKILQVRLSRKLENIDLDPSRQVKRRTKTTVILVCS